MQIIGLGTLANTGAILLGGAVGLLCGRAVKPRMQQTIVAGMAVATMFVGVAGTLKEMFRADVATGDLHAHGAFMMVMCLAAGAVLGELLNLDDAIERFGGWIRRVTRNERDDSFINAFVTASLTFCIGAMAIVGSIEDGLNGQPETLYLKAVMDGVFTAALVVSLGKGAVFSAIPILLYQGGITLGARALAPVFTPAAMSNLSLVGNVLIFCVGWNIIHGEKKVRVANLLPALVLAVAWAFVP